MKRLPPDTVPPTYTAGEVALILKKKVTEVQLERWDKSRLFRPSYYWADGHLIPPEERDRRVEAQPYYRGNPRRRYTYHDLVWLRLLVYVKDHYGRVGVPSAGRRSATVVARIRQITGDQCPPAARLFFVGRGDAYLLHDRGIAEHLSDDRQLAMRILLTDTVFAEVEGRIAVLEAMKDIRSIRATGDA